VRAGAPLTDEATCAERVRAAPGEPRPANQTPNHRVTTAAEVAQLEPWDSAHGYDNKALALQQRITGNFSGTTDEILQWAACKWGFDEDLVRAEAVHSSGWRQTVATDWTEATSSDCPPGAATPTTTAPRSARRRTGSSRCCGSTTSPRGRCTATARPSTSISCSP
jgi:autotransporter family porin